MANGRVCTGFSKPYVAKYSASGSTVTYSSGMVLARGVSVSIEPGSDDSNVFYADNTTAETEGGILTSGTLNLTVDGLKDDARKFIMGLPTADTAGWTSYGDDQVIPYVGVGFIARYMSGGATSYVPTVICKCAFNQIPDAAETQGEKISFQTQSLTASISRGDDANHNWKFMGKEYTTEAAAEAALKTKLSIT